LKPDILEAKNDDKINANDLKTTITWTRTEVSSQDFGKPKIDGSRFYGRKSKELKDGNFTQNKKLA